MTIQELLKIAGEQGKVVIVGDDGELKAVLMSGQEYQQLAGAVVEEIENEAEKINREILRAQLEEVMALPGNSQLMVDPPESIGSLLSRRAEDLFRSMPANVVPPEVMNEADEEIKPNFDDI